MLLSCAKIPIESNTSAETQLPPFIKFIQMRQLLSEVWVKEVLEIGIAYLRVAEMRRFAADISIKIVWPTLTDEDNRLMLDTLKWAYGVGLIDDENTVRLMPVDIENADEMLAKLRLSNALDDGERFDKATVLDAEMFGNGNGKHPLDIVPVPAFQEF